MARSANHRALPVEPQPAEECSEEHLDFSLPLVTRNCDNQQTKKTAPTCVNLEPPVKLAATKHLSYAELGCSNQTSTFSPLAAGWQRCDSKPILSKNASQ